MSVFAPVCSSCIHLNDEQDLPDVYRCKAYPKGIPNDLVWTTYNEHDTVQKGQEGTYIYTFRADRVYDEPAEMSPYRTLLHPHLSTKRKRIFWFNEMASIFGKDQDLATFTVTRPVYGLSGRRFYAYYWDRAYDALLSKQQVFCVVGITSHAPDFYVFETMSLGAFSDYAQPLGLTAYSQAFQMP